MPPIYTQRQRAADWMRWTCDTMLLCISAAYRSTVLVVRSSEYQFKHFRYFVYVILVGVWFLYLFGDDRYNISWPDALLLTTSAVCGVGLSSINLGWLTGFQQVILLIKMLLGDSILIHTSILWIKQRHIREDKKKRCPPAGLEYCKEEHALEMLQWRFVFYVVFCVVSGFIAMVCHLLFSDAGKKVRTAQPGNLDPILWAGFNADSSFTNTGMDLENKSMVQFNTDYTMLIISAVLTMTGKTLWPICMRYMLWLEWKFRATRNPASRECRTLRFILDNPRQCHPLLFPAKPTLLLLFGQIGYTLLAWFVWLGIQLPSPPADLQDMSTAQIAAVGFFQSIQLRASGMMVVPASAIAGTLSFFYLGFFYFSIYPFTITVEYVEEAEAMEQGRHQERALVPQTKDYHTHIARHLKSRLLHELSIIFIAVFLICCIEGYRDNNSVFKVMFEVSSAYSNNGMSLGVDNDDYSFCGSWHTLSKFILIFMMLMGRHRILPRTVDCSGHLRDWPLREPGQGQPLLRNVDGERGAAESVDSMELDDLDAEGRRIVWGSA